MSLERTKMLEVNGWFKIAEEDNWEEGCRLEYTSYSGTERFTAKTQDDLIQKLMGFVGTDDRETVLVNSCEELGRIDIQVYEDSEGCPATEFKMEQFKKGNFRIWIATYIFHVEEVERNVAQLV